MLAAGAGLGAGRGACRGGGGGDGGSGSDDSSSRSSSNNNNSTDDDAAACRTFQKNSASNCARRVLQ